ALLLDIDFDQGAATSSRPVIAFRIELAARRARIRAGIGLVELAGLAVINHHAVPGPGTAAEIAVVPAHCAAICGREFLGLDLLQLVAVGAADPRDLALAQAPDIAFLVEGIIAAHRRIDWLLNVPM